jgi:hypothetical protein
MSVPAQPATSVIPTWIERESIWDSVAHSFFPVFLIFCGFAFLRVAFWLALRRTDRLIGVLRGRMAFREFAATALGYLGDPIAVEALADASKSKTWNISKNAKSALGDLTSSSVGTMVRGGATTSATRTSSSIPHAFRRCFKARASMPRPAPVRRLRSAGRSRDS